MSSILNTKLQAKSVATVLVFLKPSVPREQGRSVLEHFVPSPVSHAGALAMAAGTKANAVPKGRYYPNLGVLLGSVDRSALANLRHDERVRRVSGTPPLRLIKPVSVKAGKLTGKMTWGLRALGIKALWDEGLDGSDVAVGHLDTGVDVRHPTLRSAVADFVELDFLGRRKQQGAENAFDSEEHGTHTAATIAGRPVRGRHVGVAPGARLFSALVIEGGDVVARVLGGLEWALEHQVKVVSMSLGFPGFFDDFLDLTRILRTRGVVPVVAVGNEGPGTSRSPGNYAEVVSVGASNRARRVADFSSSEQFARPDDPIVPDLVAPGVGVLSAKPGRGFQAMAGSSMAAPHVAGLAALLWQAKPTASVAQIEQAILGSCEPLANDLPARQGRGFPSARVALRLLTGGPK